jgi:hypothetical protein
MLNGLDFIAIVRISNRENVTLAAAGATCERVPAHLLESLERRRKIRRAQPAATDGFHGFVTGPVVFGGPDSVEHVQIVPAGAEPPAVVAELQKFIGKKKGRD